ncbi:MAG: DUF4082 domain-containing protein [Propionibacteriales bacterium]|nr:DUF4082 domain-containing protein [Propionibacteriales bacterium]
MSGSITKTSRVKTPLRHTAATLCMLLLAALLTTVTTTSSSAAIDPCGASGNKIACENSKPGSPASEWDNQYGAGDSSIQGFSTDISVNVGTKVDFKIDTSASAYSITIYRTGYYGGDGARKITTITPSAPLPQNQPQCITEATTQLYDCGSWAVSASWNVPATAVSGVYIARLKRTDTGGASQITFIVRDDLSRSDVVFQTSDPTWQAYNSYGGSNFYYGGANGRSYKQSYNRPIATRGGIGGRDFYFSNEYPMVRFLEQNGYDVSYISGVDTDRFGPLLKNHKTYLSVGHDEYWSKAQRANVEAARDAGVNLMFVSGNEVYWKTRYEPSADASRTDYRTLVSYKETWDNQKSDPSPEWTGTWRDPRFAPKDKGGGMPENGLTGTLYMSNDSDLAVTVSSVEGKLRLWRNSGLQSMTAGTTTALAPHTVGYESNEDLDNGARPQGLIRLSTTTGSVPQYLQDYGNSVAPGTTTHHLTMYRAPSGALVFSAGTIQWTWGLDAQHDSPNGAPPADRRMQQAQVNLLADMSAQPTTLDPTLTAATKSTDTTAPTATITAPANNATIANGTSVTATGTAADTGGQVAGVEVSSDNGASWHPATGTTSWSYTYIQHGTGITPLKVRAIDDSANIGTAASRSLTVNCPCNVFGAEVPQSPAAVDTAAVELGLRFSPNADGFISGVRFYKGTGNSGTHKGSLWSSGGQQLATVTFTGETTTGWQQANFTTPVVVSKDTTYVVSYTAPSGRYASAANAFTANGVAAPPLSVAGGFGATPAGVYANPGQFPNTSYKNTNYYVDAMYTTSDASPLSATNQWPLADSSSVPANTTVSATFSKPLVAGTAALSLKDANGATVSGSVSYNTTTRVITFTPGANLNGFVKYSATVAGTDLQGNPVTTGKTWSFTTAKPPAAPGVCPCSLFDDSTVPTVLEVADPDAVTLGVRFASDTAGTVTAVKFYKGPNNTGSHTGTLWSSAGTKLAEGTFSGESSSGWQTLTFAQPVAISKDTEYVASYRTTVGKYSASPGGFTSARIVSPLRTASGSGAYTYSTGFPSASSSTNYFVDVVFERPAPQIAITTQDPASGAVDVSRSASIGVWFNDTIRSGYTMGIKQGTTTIAGNTTLSSDATSLTFKPDVSLPKDADITVTLTGVTSTSGAQLGTQTWTFRTVAIDDPTQPQTLFTDQLPTTSDAAASAVELGTAFSPSKAGKIRAIRFYKGTGNSGTHTGRIWSSSGQQLASVQFTNETPNGWQSATLSTPLAVSAGQTYVVSYLAPQGHYSYTPGFFNTPLTSGDLTAPAANNGRYLYGATGGFPIYTYGAANYFVDVSYLPDLPKVTLTAKSPAANATDVPRSSNITATFSAPITTGYTLAVKQGTTPIAGTTTLSTDKTKLTFQPTSTLPADADITVTLSGVVSTEGAVLPTQTWTFRTEALSTTLYSLFADQTPTTPSINDTDAVELGTAFTPSVAGTITGVSFFKGTGNGGTHVGNLWSSTGTNLGTVTFSGESGSGWQSASFATPIAVAAGQTYVVSYLAPQGRYSGTPGFFNNAYTAGPLSARAGNNGLYTYGAAGGFPTGSWNSTNYFVDVVFRGAS